MFGQELMTIMWLFRQLWTGIYWFNLPTEKKNTKMSSFNWCKRLRKLKSVLRKDERKETSSDSGLFQGNMKERKYLLFREIVSRKYERTEISSV